MNSPTHLPSHFSLSLFTIKQLSHFSTMSYSFKQASQTSNREKKKKKKMSDWGPVLVTVILFVMLTPGLLFQLPGRQRYVEFGNFQTSAVSVIVHSLLYFSLVCVFLLALKIHIYIA
ncbi:uncharacterized protein LOC108841273 [Raphanus sativus]|uniref:Uncharacterized protein LOC108841273 n=1 Tax=Raphanus sativus TaxID=3726 RepID=A0A6J0MAY8_RAPSA|nr:uncharacterized protein LOC108841273 [Raphanus sativus]